LKEIMPSLIEEFWVFNKDGNIIADFCDDDYLDKRLFGNFITAIKNFCEEFNGNELTSFVLEKMKFTCVSALEGNVILVCRTSEKVKDKKIQKASNVIREIFESIYNVEDIKNWDGNVDFFYIFRKKLDLYFKISNI